MSMIGQFILVTPQELQDYLGNSALLEERVMNAFEEDEEDPAFFDIDKNWEAISFLLTGVPAAEIQKAYPPLSWVVFGDHVIDQEQDLGYGPAAYLTLEQVKDVSIALNNISTADFIGNYDADQMNKQGIYPEGWDNAPRQEGWLAESFENLKAFYEKAAASDRAVITFIS
ncbi:MAG: YfbM family protein [Bacteroidetes bacterium]|nr:YfbM family protein [Bacteroidota bacterium]